MPTWAVSLGAYPRGRLEDCQGYVTQRRFESNLRKSLVYRALASPLPPYLTCDTRPLRHRPPTAYAGCMTVVRTAPIDRVYSSRPSHRQGLWLGRQTCEFDGHLATLIAGSRPRPWKHPGLRWPCGQNDYPDYSREGIKGTTSWRALATLMGRRPRRLWIPAFAGMTEVEAVRFLPPQERRRGAGATGRPERCFGCAQHDIPHATPRAARFLPPQERRDRRGLGVRRCYTRACRDSGVGET